MSSLPVNWLPQSFDGGEALVGVEHLGPALTQRLLQRVNAEVRLQSLAPDPDRGVLDNLQATTYRLCQSMTATK